MANTNTLYGRLRKLFERPLFYHTFTSFYNYQFV